MRKKKRFNWNTLIGILLMIIGITLFFATKIQDQMLRHESSRLAKTVSQEITHEQILQNRETESEFDFSIVTALSPETVANSIVRRTDLYNPNQIIGQLVIPDLNINITLFSGITNGNLLYGVSDMKENQVMGEGNYAIAGHIAYEEDVLFSNLPDATSGMEVRLTDKDKIYIYEIFETKVVGNKELYMIYDQRAVDRGKPLISLMSCYPQDISKRFFAVGELKEVVGYTLERLIEKTQ